MTRQFAIKNGIKNCGFLYMCPMHEVNGIEEQK